MYIYIYETVFSKKPYFECVCICVCVFIYIHTYTHTHIHTYACCSSAFVSSGAILKPLF